MKPPARRRTDAVGFGRLHSWAANAACASSTAARAYSMKKIEAWDFTHCTAGEPEYDAEAD